MEHKLVLNAEDDPGIYKLLKELYVLEDIEYRYATTARGALTLIRQLARERKEALASGQPEDIQRIKALGRVVIQLDGKFPDAIGVDEEPITPETEPELYADPVVARHLNVQQEPLAEGQSPDEPTRLVAVATTEIGREFANAILVGRAAVQELGADNVGFLLTTATTHVPVSPSDFLSDGELGQVPFERVNKPFVVGALLDAVDHVAQGDIRYALPLQDGTI